jgi:hypothetical protein
MRQQKCVSILSIMTKQVGIKRIARLILTGTGGGIIEIVPGLFD